MGALLWPYLKPPRGLFERWPALWVRLEAFAKILQPLQDVDRCLAGALVRRCEERRGIDFRSRLSQMLPIIVMGIVSSLLCSVSHEACVWMMSNMNPAAGRYVPKPCKRQDRDLRLTIHTCSARAYRSIGAVISQVFSRSWGIFSTSRYGCGHLIRRQRFQQQASATAPTRPLPTSSTPLGDVPATALLFAIPLYF